MDPIDPLLAQRRLLGWVSYRANKGLKSFKRSERDSALSDIGHAVQDYIKCWDGKVSEPDPNHHWMGERP